MENLISKYLYNFLVAKLILNVHWPGTDKKLQACLELIQIIARDELFYGTKLIRYIQDLGSLFYRKIRCSSKQHEGSFV